MLARNDPAYEDLATKFFEHFALIGSAPQRQGPVGRGRRLLLRRAPDRRGVRPLRVRSVVGLLPLVAVTTLGPATLARCPTSPSASLVPRAPPRARGARPAHEPRSTRAGGSWRSSTARGCAGCSRRCSIEGEFLSTAACARSRSATSEPAAHRGRRRVGPRSSTSRGSRGAACSAATRTGAGRSGSRPTTCCRRAACVPPLPPGHLPVESPPAPAGN